MLKLEDEVEGHNQEDGPGRTVASATPSVGRAHGMQEQVRCGGALRLS